MLVGLSISVCGCDGGYGALTEVLVHGVGVLGPGLEVSLVCGELLLERLDVGGVFVEKDLFMGDMVSIRCSTSAIGSVLYETSLI